MPIDAVSNTPDLRAAQKLVPFFLAWTTALTHGRTKSRLSLKRWCSGETLTNISAARARWTRPISFTTKSLRRSSRRTRQNLTCFYSFLASGRIFAFYACNFQNGCENAAQVCVERDLSRIFVKVHSPSPSTFLSRRHKLTADELFLSGAHVSRIMLRFLSA